MPKQFKKKPRVIKKRKKEHLGWFVTAGLLAVAAIWFILREPATTGVTGKEEPQTEEKATTTHKHKAKKTKQHKKSKEAPRKSDQNAQAVSEKKAVPAASGTNNIRSIDEVLKATCTRLGIPSNVVKSRKDKGNITYSIPIDRSNMDLTYANMIFKGALEQAGAKLVKGVDTAGKQSLNFSAPNHAGNYVLNLYYDSKVFQAKSKPRSIAIVVDDFGGISGDLLEGFLDVDKNVCFAIFPDQPYSRLTAEKAQAQGREAIIHVPMEPIGYPKVDPGKNAVFVQNSPGEIEHKIDKFIKDLPSCRGINNHMGSLATTDEGVMRAVMQALKKNGKFFLDSRTSNVSVAYSIAQKAHIPAFKNDMFLDSPDISQSTMDNKLNQIIAMSETRSNIIVITHCHNADKLRYLRSFISRLKSAGFSIVPLSQIGQYNVPGIL